MSDTLITLHNFSQAVTEALNINKIKPPSEDTVSAIMIVVGKEYSDEPPIGCSVNYDRETTLWIITGEAETALKLS